MAEKSKGSTPTVPVPTGPPPQTEFDSMQSRVLDGVIMEDPDSPLGSGRPLHPQPARPEPAPTRPATGISSAEEAAMLAHQAAMRYEDQLMESRPRMKVPPRPETNHAPALTGSGSAPGGLVMVRADADPDLVDCYRVIAALRGKGLIVTQSTFNEVDTLLTRIAAKISVPSGGVKPVEALKGS